MSSEPPGTFPPYGSVAPAPSAFSPSDAVAWGWRKFKANFGPIMVGFAIYFAFNAATTGLEVATSFALSTGADMVGSPEAPGFVAADIVQQGILEVVSVLGNFVLSAAAVRASLDVADGRAYDFISALKRVPIGKVILAQILVVCLVVTGALLLIIPGILMYVLLYLTNYFLVDDPNIRTTDALRSSARLVRANFGDSVGVGLLNMLVILAGLLVFCIGVVAAYPITVFAASYAFRAFRGQPIAE